MALKTNIAVIATSLWLASCGNAEQASPSLDASSSNAKTSALQTEINPEATPETNGDEQGTAGPWRLLSAESRVAFGSIKSDLIGEAHYFSGLTGSVSPTGKASLEIDLASVETNVDIRNQRMRDMLFEVTKFPKAIVTAEIDMPSYMDLAIGSRRTSEVDLNLSLHGAEAPLYTELTVTRLSKDRLHIETTAPVFVAAEDFDLGVGINALKEAAGLEAITPVSPVTVSLLFEQDS